MSILKVNQIEPVSGETLTVAANLTVTGTGQSQISRTRTNDGTWSVVASGSVTIDVTIPEAGFVMLLSVGGYGSGASGNVIGLYHIAGNGNAAANTTIRIIDAVATAGTITCAWQAAGVLRVTITNTHETQTKSGSWRSVLS